MAPEPNDQMSSLLAYLASYVETHTGTTRDPEKTYALALDSLVDMLLSNGRAISGADASFRTKLDDLPMPEPASLKPEDVGSLYENLRGFRLRTRQAGDLQLTPCIRGKRNQGLFYTPSTIVQYIVERTLECLEISDPEDFLNLRVLDPAVGTGVFLAETLEQMSARVGNLIGDDGIEATASGIRRSSRKDSDRGESVRELGPLVRTHIVENCLFGVDLDPTAVRIARAVLLDRLRANPSTREVRPNILRGNSLKGEGARGPIQPSKADLDESHSTVLRKDSTRKKQSFFHWPLEFPQVFSEPGSGFDAVIGNPPYEILSVKESGIQSRRDEQIYFRRFFDCCSGKINTYRLMIERALQLLREGGVLGFIVPATLLGDSTAEKLRRMILDRTTVSDAVVIPEKAKVFPGVTQALLILITRKGGSTDKIEPVFWEGQGPIPKSSKVSIPRSVIQHLGFRVPLIRTKKELELLQAVSRFPRLGGDRQHPEVGQIHQGEINLTVHRDFITAEKTGYPLIRGEHVNPLRVAHPASGDNRLDWVVDEFVRQHNGRSNPPGPKAKQPRAIAWETGRIVLARVVNMDTERRLKAAFVGPGVFLGDMTNFLANPTLPYNYLLGLLNSRLLNWRMKLTSTNNYISAAELAALPVPRIPPIELPQREVRIARRCFDEWISEQECSVLRFTEKVSSVVKPPHSETAIALISEMIQWITAAIQEPGGNEDSRTLWNLLDALVVVLYGAERFSEVLAADERR